MHRPAFSMNGPGAKQENESSWLRGQNTTYFAAWLMARRDLTCLVTFRQMLEQFWPVKQARDAHEFYAEPPPGFSPEVTRHWQPRSKMPAEYQTKRDDLLKVLPEAKRVACRCGIKIDGPVDELLDSTMSDESRYDIAHSALVQAEGACEHRLRELRRRWWKPWTLLRDLVVGIVSVPVEVGAVLGADTSKAAHLVVVRVVQTMWVLILMLILVALFGRRAVEQLLPSMLKLLR